MRLVFGIFVLFVSSPLFGVDQALEDPALEARARALMTELRCLVCQNQSIVDSDAGLAQDLRDIVRERVSAGESDDVIKAYLVDRYGDWVLMRPPVKPGTWLLWGSPFLLLVFGASIWFLSRRKASEPTPLSEAETARLKALLGDEDRDL